MRRPRTAFEVVASAAARGRSTARRGFRRVAQPRQGPQPRNDPVSTPPKPGETLGAGQWLDARAGHEVWWCEGGDPQGLPVLIVHGGPGGASRVEPTRWFAGLPVRWIAIDQRGCGRSRPLGVTAANTLGGLLDDMERLRERLGLARWAMAGGSWGARLALAYAARWPARVVGLMLRSPFLGTGTETRRYIAAWAGWLGADGRAWIGADAADAVDALYHGATAQTDAGTGLTLVSNERVARTWTAYDDAQSAPGGVAAAAAHWSEASLPHHSEALAASWRVHLHHAQRGWGAADGHARGASLEAAAQWGPISLVWGADDATCDPAVARTLARALPAAQSVEVAAAGHRMGDARLAPALRTVAVAWVAALRRADAARP